MSSERIYYENAYTRSFSATVTSVIEDGGEYLLTLDKTAFFPEGGGQGSDTGRIADAKVLHVFERGGEILHRTDKPLTVGKAVECEIDFDLRFEKMQLHTAEHLLSGLFHTHFGATNTGFHLSDAVTFDIDKQLNASDIEKIERLANAAIYENRPVYAYFPSESELSSLSYRSKLDISEGVRIVTIEGYDSCACCAPHLATTAEIGIIKIISHQKHRGGTRLVMLAGRRAYIYLSELHKRAERVSALLSAKILEIDEEAERALRAKDNLAYQLRSKNMALATILADSADAGERVFLLDGFDGDAAREFVNKRAERDFDLIVALFGIEGDYRYVIKGKGCVSELVKKANAALCGKGGGRDDTAEGRFLSNISQIREYFSSLQL